MSNDVLPISNGLMKGRKTDLDGFFANKTGFVTRLDEKKFCAGVI